MQGTQGCFGGFEYGEGLALRRTIWEKFDIIAPNPEDDVEERPLSRAAPSMHIRWQTSEQVGALYVEVEVSETCDATYYMTAGFQCGYSGIQQKDPQWALFSIWDADDGTNVECRASGTGVTVKRFGGEGVGLQSFKSFPWKTGQRYATLVLAEREDIDDKTPATTFTGYVCDHKGNWHLLSALRRKGVLQQGTLNCLYSFIEDWAGNGKKRSGIYGPAWIRVHGQWKQILNATGTCNADATENKCMRLHCSKKEERIEMISGGSLDLYDCPGIQGPWKLPASEMPENLKKWIRKHSSSDDYHDYDDGADSNPVSCCWFFD